MEGLAGMILSKDLKVPGSVEGAEISPVKGIRKVIADRMIESLQNTAQLTLHTSFELTQAQAYRAQRLKLGSPRSRSMTSLPMALSALQAHPELNAHFLCNRIATFEKFTWVWRWIRSVAYWCR